MEDYFLIDESIKTVTRIGRGAQLKVKRYHVQENTPLPTSWEEFLKNTENKKEFNQFLAQKLKEAITLDEGKLFIATHNENVLIVPEGVISVDLLQPCNHEEAETRMFLHTLHAALNGSVKVTIKSNDSDVVILGTSLYDRLELEELDITFGSGNNYQIIPIHVLHRLLGENVRESYFFIASQVVTQLQDCLMCPNQQQCRSGLKHATIMRG